jgi:hypothetical protein
VLTKKSPLNAIEVSGNLGLRNRSYAFSSYSKVTDVVFTDNRAIQSGGGFDLSFGSAGNDTARPDNCALLNVTRPAYPLDARNNYWGSAAGPGSDPADDAGASGTICAVAPTQVAPFATQAFPVAH